MHRFFIDNNLIDDNHAFLNAEDSKHAVKVLRLTRNDRIVVCDKYGFDYEASIISADKTNVEVQLSNKKKSATEPKVKTTLIQCLPKSGKMEFIIQKCVELGVSEIIPAISQRCVVKVSINSKNSKTERYNRIAYEAAKQSKRGIIPTVSDIIELANIDYSCYDCVLVPYEGEECISIKQLFSANKLNAANIAIVIGSEGGFSSEEIDSLKSKGGNTLTLGKRILRTETAGMATLAMLYCLLEG